MHRIYKAFFHSMAGFAHALRTERAIRQEFALLLAGVPLALWIGPTPGLKLALILSLVAILCIEFLNTCLEKLCDHVTPERHEHIKVIKDMGSSACFCVQAGAALVWIFVLSGWVA